MVKLVYIIQTPLLCSGSFVLEFLFGGPEKKKVPTQRDYADFISGHVAHADDTHYSDQRRSHVLMIPHSDIWARGVYTGPDWTTIDKMGYPLVAPSEGMWHFKRERVPRWLFNEVSIQLGLLPFRTDSGIIGVPLQVTDISVTYLVGKYKFWSVKYQYWCPSPDEPFDISLRETYFQNLVHEHHPEVTNELKYVSAAYTPTRLSEWKTRGLERLECSTDPTQKVSVRFIISERVDITVHRFVEIHEMIPLAGAIGYGIQLFEHLQRLAQMDIVHGNITPKSVAFRAPLKLGEVILVDFRAATIRSEYDASVPSNQALLKDHPNIIDCGADLSYWESRIPLSRKAPRDDAWAVLWLMAYMMHGVNFELAQELWCDMDLFVEYLAYKDGNNMFELSVRLSDQDMKGIYQLSFRDVIPEEFPDEVVETVRNDLESVVHQIHRLEYSQVPDYEEVIRQLRAVRSLLEIKEDLPDEQEVP